MEKYPLALQIVEYTQLQTEVTPFRMLSRFSAKMQVLKIRMWLYPSPPASPTSPAPPAHLPESMVI